MTAPRLVARGGSAPRFVISEDADRWVALEVAITPPSLADLSRHADLGMAWSSWSDSMTRPCTIALPQDIWQTMSGAEQLYYRAHSSASPTEWVDHRVTVTDDRLAAAPCVRICNAWRAPADDPRLDQRGADLIEKAAAHPDFRYVQRGVRLEVLVCLHQFAAGRPTVPDALEWVVVIASQSVGWKEVQFLIQRFEYDGLQLIASHQDRAPGDLGPINADHLPPLPAGTELDVERWSRLALGPFLVLRDNSPAPMELGGTCILLPAVNRCLYLASCRWSGERVIYSWS